MIMAGAWTGLPTAFAGKLGDFERSATEERGGADKRSQSQSGREQKGSSSCFDPIVSDVGSVVVSDTVAPAANSCFGGLFVAMGEGGANSTKRIDPVEVRPGERIDARKEGEALIPFLRVDLAYQNVESDVIARDVRAEAGYGAVGFQLRRTVYEEENPPDRLETLQYYLLYRMSFGSFVEVDAGIGSLLLTGKEKNSGLSLTIPVIFHPTDYFGVEFRPAWSTINDNSIHDLDAGVLFGGRYASLRAGYRWFKSGRESLDGPYAGVALRW